MNHEALHQILDDLKADAWKKPKNSQVVNLAKQLIDLDYNQDTILHAMLLEYRD